MRYTGETVDAALSKGLADLNVGRDQVEVTVICEGRKGFLGIGRKAAEVEITVLTNVISNEDQYSAKIEDEITNEIRESEGEDADFPKDAENKAQEDDEGLDDVLQLVGNYLEEIVSQMGIEADISVTVDRRMIYFDFDTDQQGLLIGKHGRTLNALQILAQAYLDKRIKRRYRIILDVGEYRERRRKELQRISTELAQRAIIERRAFKLGPMPAIERKIVHKALVDNHHIKAKSHGNDPYRYIVIAPKLK